MLPSDYQTYIAKSRYARYLPSEKRRETWGETVDRYVSYFGEKYPDTFPVEEIRKTVTDLEVMPSMRSVMTAGKALDRDNASGYNCLSGDTLVTTLEYGIIPIEKLEGKSVHVVDGNGEWTLSKCSYHGVQQLYKINFATSGTGSFYIRATGDHRWIMKNGQEKFTKDLISDDRVQNVKMPERPFIDEDSEDYKSGVVHGIVYGDGTASYKCRSGGRNTYVEKICKGFAIRLCGDSQPLEKYFKDYSCSHPKSYNGDPVFYIFNKAIDLKSTPDLEIGFFSDDYIVGFIRGWLSADGSVTTSSQVSLTSNEDGIKWIETYGPKYGFCVLNKYQLDDSAGYGRKTKTFTAYFDRRWMTKDDFILEYKSDRFKKIDCLLNPGYGKIVDIVEDSVEDVYCFEVPTTHSFLLTKNLLTGNCSYLAVDDQRAFDETMYLLMNGVGVGFSVERQFISKLPSISEEFFETDSVIVVKDSKIGWASSLKELISLLYQGLIPKWDLSLVRPAGAPLKIFGGRASGPDPLNELFHFFVMTFKNATGRKLNSIECNDLLCKIGEAVVVGGVRRSACICLTNLSDDRMRVAKSGQWWNTSPQRALANISVAYTEKPDVGQFMEEWLSLYNSKAGERGIFNRVAAVKKIKNIGRRQPEPIQQSGGINPCQTSWAKVLTPDGIREFKDIEIGSKIWSKEGWTTVTNKWSTGVKPVFKYETTSSIFYGTNNHRIVSNGEKIEVGVAESIDSLRGFYETDYIINPEDVMDGLVIGDGTKHEASGNLLLLCIGENDKDYFNSEIKDLIIKYRPGINSTVYEVKTTITDIELPKTYERRVPERFISDKNKLVGFLRGLYSANGSVCGNRITLKSSSKKLVEDVQLMLSSIGIRSYYTTNKPSNVKFSNGEYLCKQSYDINITTDRERFVSIIGFIQEYKNEKIKITNTNDGQTTYNIVNVESLGEEEVFDITVDNSSHTYWTQGCDVSNCGEIVLRSCQFCNLSEVIIRPNDTLETILDKVRIATIIGTHQATLTNFRYLRSIWKKNTEEERLLGVSLTGIMDHDVFSGKKGSEVLVKWLTAMKECAIEVNKDFSEKLGINQSVGITTTKPSGCTTLNTKVKTTEGIKSMAEIFFELTEENIFEKTPHTWIKPSKDMFVFDENNEKKKITNLFINGISEVYEIEDEAGNTYKFTAEHKLKTTNGWKRVDVLTEDDEIISF